MQKHTKLCSHNVRHDMQSTQQSEDNTAWQQTQLLTSQVALTDK